MDCQCIVVYTMISPSTTIAPSLRVQLERALSRSSTPGCISWIKYSVKRLISHYSPRARHLLFSHVDSLYTVMCVARVHFVRGNLGCGIADRC